MFACMNQNMVIERCELLAGGVIVDYYEQLLSVGRVETYTWDELYLSVDADPGLNVAEPSHRPIHATRPDSGRDSYS